MQRPEFDWCTRASVYIEMYFGNTRIAHGSGFIARREIVFGESKLTGPTHLVTNRHNVTGLDSGNRRISKTGDRPDRLRIWFYHPDGWKSLDKSLYFEPGVPAWKEHPQLGRRVDIVAIELEDRLAQLAECYDPREEETTPIAWGIASELKVIGFPYRLDTDTGVPVWTRGTVATEPAVDFRGDRAFLIDSRTRRGQSGSPVVLWTDGHAFPNDSGSISMSRDGVSLHCLVGVYAARVDPESDLGIVWKASLVREIVDGQFRPSAEDLWPDS